jgi:hypothetical protein
LRFATWKCRVLVRSVRLLIPSGSVGQTFKRAPEDLDDERLVAAVVDLAMALAYQNRLG